MEKYLVVAVLLAFGTCLHLQSHLVLQYPTDPANFDLAQTRQDELARHNFLRANHNSPPLSLDDNLNADCQAYA